MCNKLKVCMVHFDKDIEETLTIVCIQMSARFFCIQALYSFTPVPKYDTEPERRYEYECLLYLDYKMYLSLVSAQWGGWLESSNAAFTGSGIIAGPNVNRERRIQTKTRRISNRMHWSEAKFK